MNLSIRQRVLFTAALQIAVLAVLVGLAMHFRSIERHASAAADDGTAAQAAMQTLLRGLGETMLTEGSSTALKGTAEAVARFDKQLTGLHAHDAATLGLASSAAAEADKSWAAMRTLAGTFLAHKKYSVDNVDQMVAYGKLSSLGAGLVKHLDAVNQQVAQAQATARASLSTMVMAGLALFVAVLLVGSWLVVHALSRPLNDAIALARDIAAGQLNTVVRESSVKEFAALMHELARMQQSLVASVRTMRAAADQLGTSSLQIAEGAADLSGRSANQAGSLEQTVSSMAELTSTVQSTAQLTRDTNAKVNLATQAAAKGNDAVNLVVATMDQINGSSRRIGDIISVIDGIAFQTNILALNAAVEAARAGEQGRGFAVVASEVRSLAQRSADAAREIKTLISASVQCVDTGTTHVATAGGAMAEVLQSIESVNALMRQIDEAASAQSGGISRIAEALRGVESATHQNSALVEESAASADGLKQLAGELQQAMSRYQLGAAA